MNFDAFTSEFARSETTPTEGIKAVTVKAKFSRV